MKYEILSTSRFKKDLKAPVGAFDYPRGGGR